MWAAAYGNSTYVVVGDSGTILSSSNGTTWTTRNSVGSSLYVASFGNSVFVAVGLSGTILSSSDGSSWTSRSGGDGQLDEVTFGNGKFILPKSKKFLKILQSFY